MTLKSIILDTSVFLSGIPIDFKDSELITTQSVSNELKPGGKDYRNFQFQIDKGLIILSPSQISIDNVKEAAKKSGDITRLSNTDIDLIALALDLINEKKEVTIITDDYSIQNISDILNISYKSINQVGIKKKFKWIYRCQGCKKYYKEHLKTCPICGSALKTVKSKNK